MNYQKIALKQAAESEDTTLYPLVKKRIKRLSIVKLIVLVVAIALFIPLMAGQKPLLHTEREKEYSQLNAQTDTKADCEFQVLAEDREPLMTATEKGTIEKSSGSRKSRVTLTCPYSIDYHYFLYRINDTDVILIVQDQCRLEDYYDDVPAMKGSDIHLFDEDDIPDTGIMHTDEFHQLLKNSDDASVTLYGKTVEQPELTPDYQSIDWENSDPFYQIESMKQFNTDSFFKNCKYVEVQSATPQTNTSVGGISPAGIAMIVGIILILLLAAEVALNRFTLRYPLFVSDLLLKQSKK